MKKIYLTVLAVVVLLAGCEILLGDLFEEEGSLVVTLRDEGVETMTITPDIEMLIASYDISGSGPDSDTFLESGVTTTTFVKNNLKVGAWTITVEAKNASGDIIAEGTGIASIQDGQTTTIDITVEPVDGNGTFEFTLEWPADQIDVPSVNATLTELDGMPVTCTFSISGESATCSETLTDGYYDLTLQLLDDGVVAWGDAYSIRVIAGETTSYTELLTVTDINPLASGDLEVNIAQDLQNPVTITFAGVDTSLRFGDDMTVSASLDPTITPDSLQWYIDGAAVSGATSNAVTRGGALPEGFHRIALIIHHENMSSSHSEWFEVTADEKIVFVSYRDGNPEIYVMNSDGSNQLNLSNNSGSDSQPARSSDKSKIAFLSNRSGIDEVYVMDADGSNLTQLTSALGAKTHPTWSPDGLRIAFSCKSGAERNIYVMNSDGSNITEITNNVWDEHDASWSPDGTRIAYSSLWSTYRDIYTVDPDGSNPINLSNNQSSHDWGARWSPDGSKITFASTRHGLEEVYVMDADGSNQIRLTDSAGSSYSTSWSVDGTKIAFGSDRDGDWDVYVMNSDGTNQVNLTNGSTSIDSQPSWGSGP